MNHIDYTTKSLRLKDKNITITDIKTHGSYTEIIATLDYAPNQCPHCQSDSHKYDFQKPSRIPYLELFGYKTIISLKKRRFQCKSCHRVTVASTNLVEKNCQIANPVKQKVAQELISQTPMSEIAKKLGISTTTVVRELEKFSPQKNFSTLPEIMSWDEFAFKKGEMCFIAQNYETSEIIAILDGRTKSDLLKYFLKYPMEVRQKVKFLTSDMYTPYIELAKKLFPNAKIIIDRFHVIQHLSRAMNRTRVRIMSNFKKDTIEYRSMKYYWRLLLKDSEELSSKTFYSRTFNGHFTCKDIVEKMTTICPELHEAYQMYQILFFHFKQKDSQAFFDCVKSYKKSCPELFLTVFKTFLKLEKEITNALNYPPSNARIEATNNLIKVIKRKAFGFRVFSNFKTRILMALNVKRDNTYKMLSRQ